MVYELVKTYFILYFNHSKVSTWFMDDPLLKIHCEFLDKTLFTVIQALSVAH